MEFLHDRKSQGLTVEHQNRAKNHATIKLDLQSDVDEYNAVRINMMQNQLTGEETQTGANTYLDGLLYIKPVKYTGESLSTSRTYEIDFWADATLRHLLSVIEETGVY